MSAEKLTVTEVLLASLSILLLISTLTISILLSNLTREISRTQSKLHSLLTSIDVRIREISEAIIALRLDLNADRDKEELAPKPKSRDPW